MGSYTIFEGFENPRRGRQARNLTTNVPKIIDLKSSSEQIFSKNCGWVPLNRYVPPQRVGFLRRFGLKTGIDFAHFGLESHVV